MLIYCTLGNGTAYILLSTPLFVVLFHKFTNHLMLPLFSITRAPCNITHWSDFMMTDIIFFDLDVYEPCSLKFLSALQLIYRAVRELNVAAFVTFNMSDGIFSHNWIWVCVCLCVWLYLGKVLLSLFFIKAVLKHNLHDFGSVTLCQSRTLSFLHSFPVLLWHFSWVSKLHFYIKN